MPKSCLVWPIQIPVSRPQIFCFLSTPNLVLWDPGHNVNKIHIGLHATLTHAKFLLRMWPIWFKVVKRGVDYSVEWCKKQRWLAFPENSGLEQSCTKIFRIYLKLIVQMSPNLIHYCHWVSLMFLLKLSHKMSDNLM